MEQQLLAFLGCHSAKALVIRHNWEVGSSLSTTLLALGKLRQIQVGSRAGAERQPIVCFKRYVMIVLLVTPKRGF
jgi:hypothetical protein